MEVNITFEDIVFVVCKENGVSVEDFKAKKISPLIRKDINAWVSYLVRHFLDMSYVQLASNLGYTYHDTVNRYVKKLTVWVESYPEEHRKQKRLTGLVKIHSLRKEIEQISKTIPSKNVKQSNQKSGQNERWSEPCDESTNDNEKIQSNLSEVGSSYRFDFKRVHGEEGGGI